MSDVPSTGDPVIDDVVREEFTEAIALTRQILEDRLGETVDAKVLDTLSVVIPIQIWRPLANIVMMGIRKEFADAQDEEG